MFWAFLHWALECLGCGPLRFTCLGFAFGLQCLGFSFEASTFEQVSGLFTFGLLALGLLAFAQAERQRSRMSLCLGHCAFGVGLVLLNF